jgi:serine/threonine protein kinase
MNDQDEIQGEAGTKSFLTPEHFLGKAVKGQKADIWAAGATFYQLAFGKTPFFAKTLDELKQLIINKEEAYPEDTDPDFRDFLRKCLTKDPNQRATLEDLIGHSFITLGGRVPLEFEGYEQEVMVSEKEIQQAITKLTVFTTFTLTT